MSKVILILVALACIAFGSGFGCLPMDRSCQSGQTTMWDDGITLHPINGPIESGQNYRCVQPGLVTSCTGSRTPYRQDLNGHLLPGPGGPGELVRCVGNLFEG